MSEFIEIMTLVGIIAASWLVGFLSYMLIQVVRPKKD